LRLRSVFKGFGAAERQGCYYRTFLLGLRTFTVARGTENVGAEMTGIYLTSTLWEMLIGRIEGPLTLRLVLQPTMASFLAVRAGLKDARVGRPAYLWKVFTNPSYRYDLLHHGWKDVRIVFLMAFLLDSAYQLIVFRWIYLGQAVIVAIILAVVPYVLLRGPVNRLMTTTRKPSAPES
jgi:hypothetical protein